MNRILNVHLLPDLADPHALAGNTSVVIDVLRASTTITTALDSGARRIIPCLTVSEARKLAQQRPGSLLGGERKGQPLPGFDFGNSPAEYSATRVTDRTIVFTTTNGTRAMARCVGSARVVIGCLINRASLCESLRVEEHIDLICAGTDGQISMDDALAAGAIVERLSLTDERWQLNDAALLCHQFWLQSDGESLTPGALSGVLEQSLGGRNLVTIGLGADLRLASALDSSTTVPTLDRANWEITS